MESIAYKPLQARVMAWDERLQAVVGAAPGWVEKVSAGGETSRDFLASLHCLLQISGLATENWSRVGLEAMASGTAIVTDRRGGWPEMIDHGKTGFLATSPQEAADYAGRLAANESLRHEVIDRARRRLPALCDGESIMRAWSRLFEGIEQICNPHLGKL
jgi:glycosyltransferase involved in cell wall biosynthesis